jgi:hypothetical protein
VSFLVSFANEISHGRYLGPALACLAFALGVLVWQFARELRAPSPPVEARSNLISISIWVALASMPVTALLDPKILAHPHTSLLALRAFEVLSIPMLATYLPFLDRKLGSKAARDARFWAFAALTLAAGTAIIHISPAPVIDVWDLQMHGARALLRGENPYVSVTVPDTTPIHPFPTVPYVYSPGSLYAGVIGLLVGGDVRYAMLLALVISGVALRAITLVPDERSREPFAALAEDAPALFVWLMPPLAFILELAWTEPVQLMCICVGAAAVARGRTKLGAVMFGLAVTSKQSMVWLVPLAGFAFGFRLGDWVVMLATAAVGVAPFAIADFGALKFDTVDFLMRLIPRSDALGVAVWFKLAFGLTFPTSLSPIAAASTVGVTVLRAVSLEPSRRGRIAPRAALFGCAAALTYFAFFFFAKQAFANYYFLVSGLAALAAATSLHAERAEDSSTFAPLPFGPPQ